MQQSYIDILNKSIHNDKFIKVKIEILSRNISNIENLINIDFFIHYLLNYLNPWELYKFFIFSIKKESYINLFDFNQILNIANFIYPISSNMLKLILIREQLLNKNKYIQNTLNYIYFYSKPENRNNLLENKFKTLKLKIRDDSRFIRSYISGNIVHLDEILGITYLTNYFINNYSYKYYEKNKYKFFIFKKLMYSKSDSIEILINEIKKINYYLLLN